MRDHFDRCRRTPWVDDIEEVAVVPDGYAEIVDAVDPTLVGVVSQPGSSRVYPFGGNARRPVPTPAGAITIASPVAGVRPRRWVTVAMHAVDKLGDDALDRAFELDSFHELEAEVLPPGLYTECSSCGALVTTRGLTRHQTTNGACAWKRAAAEVRTRWAAGWRDPYSLPGVPNTWVELGRRKHWRDQIKTVLFPRWIAVLLPATASDPLAARRVQAIRTRELPAP
jgi:hypothetical protein